MKFVRKQLKILKKNVLTSITKKNESASIDMGCKAIGRTFDCGCELLQDTYDGAAFIWHFCSKNGYANFTVVKPAVQIIGY